MPDLSKDFVKPIELILPAFLLLALLLASLWERLLSTCRRQPASAPPQATSPANERDMATARVLALLSAASFSLVLSFSILRLAHSSGLLGGMAASVFSSSAALGAGLVLCSLAGVWLPRVIAPHLGEGLASALCAAGRAATAILSPVHWLLLNICQGVALLIMGRKARSSEVRGGAAEQEMIRSVYEFSDIEVSEIMVPKPKIDSIQIDTPPEVVLRHVVESGFSRYPVYIKSIDDTVGILYNKDILSLMEKHKSFTIRDTIRPIHFVLQNAKVSEALKNMQQRHMNMFMVVNEFGSVVGLVTIEDAIEEIVGEMHDENEKPQDRVIRQANGSLLIDASLSIRELNGDFGLPLEASEDYDTLAGFMLSKIATIPKGGEQVEAGGYRFTIVNMERRRVSQVKAELLPPTQ